jgi:hypothetical protein
VYLRGEKHRIERRGRREGFAELVIAARVCGLHTVPGDLIRGVFRTLEIGMSGHERFNRVGDTSEITF